MFVDIFDASFLVARDHFLSAGSHGNRYTKCRFPFFIIPKLQVYDELMLVDSDDEEVRLSPAMEFHKTCRYKVNSIAKKLDGTNQNDDFTKTTGYSHVSKHGNHMKS